MQVGGGKGKERNEEVAAMDWTIEGRNEEESRPLTSKEALKRNTDCLYFLTLPLACKEGYECEYRHNEEARFNLRDCWYWLNGSCLNRKCSFRHLPLDCLMGIQGTTSKPRSCQRGSIPQIPAHGASVLSKPKKQSISCFFFQRGQCFKGDKCPFMHRPQPIGLPPIDDIPRYTPSYIPVGNRIAGNMTCSHLSKPTEEHLQNENLQNENDDDDESSRESTPGFDVLVGDNFQRCDYPMENDFLDELGQGGWTLFPATEFSYHPSGYEPAANLERETGSYKNEHKHDHYETNLSLKTFSEKYMDREFKLEKRVRSREETPEENDSSDLCHRQMKQRRLNNQNSIVSLDGHGDPYFMEDHYLDGERYHGHHCNEDQQKFPPVYSMRAHQQGRIKPPATKSSDQTVDEWSERQLIRERPRDRLSSIRPASYPERHDDRLKHRLPGEFATDARNLQSQFVRRVDSKLLNFTGHCSKNQQHFPPRISMNERSERQLSRERQRCRLSSTRPTSYRGSHNDRLKRKLPDLNLLGFAGPKSLAELKAAKKVE